MKNPSSTSCKMHKAVPLALITVKKVLFMCIVTRSAAFPQMGNPFDQNTYSPGAGNSPSYQQGGFGPFVGSQNGQNSPPGQYSYSAGSGGNSPNSNTPQYGQNNPPGQYYSPADGGNSPVFNSPQYGQNNPPGQYSYSPGYGGNSPNFNSPLYGQINSPGQYPYSPGYGGSSPGFNSPPYGSGAGTGSSFYGQTCPAVESIVVGVMSQAVQNETRLAASILRLHFHDCFVNGCDASVLLDDTTTFRGEKTAGPNNNSLRGFEVIDVIKSQLEYWCPGVVSCADILAIAARDSVVLSGGPSWDVVLGRKDSRTASFDEANKQIPSPFSDVQTLNSSFQSKGLSLEDMVSLSGAHTIGITRCVVFRQTLYNHSGDNRPDSTINTSFLQQLQGQCPRAGGDELPSSLDYVTPARFDNSYFANLKQQKGVLHSDRTLYDPAASGSVTSSTVDHFSSDQTAFFESFKGAMIKMGNLSPSAGTQGEIRRDCRKVN